MTTYGRVVFLDPKILLSLLMWVVYLLLLYMRWSSGWRGRRAALLATCAFVIALAAWAANYFSRVHRFCLMNLSLIGVNHQTAPVEVREQFAIPEARLPEAVKRLATHPGVEEGDDRLDLQPGGDLVAHHDERPRRSARFLHDHFHWIRSNSYRSTSTNTATAMPCGTCSASPPVSTRWSSASRRSWDR